VLRAYRNRVAPVQERYKVSEFEYFSYRQSVNILILMILRKPPFIRDAAEIGLENKNF
jgi:hypothetical protein